MELEMTNNQTGGDVPSLSLEPPKVDQTLIENSATPLGLDEVKHSDTKGLDDLNGENGDDDLVVRRIVETQSTVKNFIGAEDDKENEKEPNSALTLEKDKIALNLESQGAVNGSENIGRENGVDETENIAADEKPQSQEEDRDNEDDDGGENFDDIGDKDHDYHVGDFVWGKIRSHPWWPGRIFAPLDASAYAAKLKTKNGLLVAYFGDGSFSWCHPSQLRHFVENFDEMSKQSNSKNFVYAVEEALDEISRVVELEVNRLYIPESNQNQVLVGGAGNAGIKAETTVPEGRIGKMLISQYEPAELLAMMRDIANVNSFKGLLKFVVLKSWLSSIYIARGGYKLCNYGEPRNIEGLGDDNNSSIIDIPIQFDEDLVVKIAQKVPEVSNDKLYQRRKKKSVADVMKDNTDVFANSASANKKRGRKKKDEASESGKKKMKVSDKMAKEDLTLVLSSQSSAEKDDGDDDDVKSGKSYLAREKKKSRYLSPPYMDLKWGNKNSNSKKDSERDSEKISKIPQVGVRMAKAASQLIGGSPSILKPCLKKSLEESRSKSSEKPNINLSEISSTLNEVLHEVRSAAVNPFCLMEEKNREMMKGFFSVFRDSVFEKGSNYKNFNNGQTGEKRKSPNSEEAALEVESGSKKKKMKEASSTEEAFNPVKPVSESDDEGSKLEFVKQKLEVIAKMVEDSGTEISEELKSKLEGEMKVLLEKVN